MRNWWNTPPSQPFNLNNIVNNKVVWGTLEFIPIGDTKYSDEETAIGYWTDGSVLYRKVFLTTTPSSTWNTVADITSLNIADVISIYGTLEVTSGKYIPIPVYHNSSEYVSAYVTANNTCLNMGMSDSLKSKSCKVILIYTKN